MGEQAEEKKTINRICMGLLAHVDAGKTTLAEGILYLTGRLRKLGRVDHRDTFLDTYGLERARGITIFSKQALVTLGDLEVTLLDTPGHVDFSAEMERTLQVLDMAILIISGADGVQGHVETLWRLLRRYQVPTFLFVNKMDQAGTDREALLQEMQERLDERCIDFSMESETEAKRDTWLENVAMCKESLMDEYLETGDISLGSIRQAIARRDLFPCYFGSALKLIGVEEFLEGIKRYATATREKEDQSFGARVFKISRDAQGNRLTHVKITGGSLRVKSLINEEKVDQIRIYNGTSYKMAEEVQTGTICAVLGLSDTYSGQGLGFEKEGAIPLLEPVLTYEIELPEGCDVIGALGQLRQLEEEIPELHIVWKEAMGEIHAQVMGEVQIEILKSLIKDRFQMDVNFSTGSIVYKETIAAAVEGIGHFEPLRHYAEVHLLLEPGEPGSGLQFGSVCSEDVLDRNWQRLIMTHLEERQHVGVLTGSEITDMRITLVTGRAHLKHTEGGDFRQATYRAVRQGLRKAPCILLEPVYDFTLELPTDMIGRAMTDIQKMQGSFQTPETAGELTILKGKAPVINMRGYQTEVIAYTRGRGRLLCTLSGYEPCHNTEEVMAQIGYQPEADLDNPTGSVFCAHGAGFVVSWDQVERFAHVESGLDLGKSVGLNDDRKGTLAEMDTAKKAPAQRASSFFAAEDELEEIFTRTYGPIKRDRNHFSRNRGQELLETRNSGNKTSMADRDMHSTSQGHVGNVSQNHAGSASQSPWVKSPKGQEEYLLVDGYNIIFAWEDLKELAKTSIDGARNKLMDILCNYQGFRKNTVIVVFDAYKVKGNPGSIEKYHNIYVVYTKEAETADQYIEKTVHQIGKKYQVTVATSDALEQMIIWGQGAIRLSARGFWEEIQSVNDQIREAAKEVLPHKKNLPFEEMSDKFTINEVPAGDKAQKRH